MHKYQKPLPRGEEYNGEFYQFCKRHELRFQRCLACKAWRHMPRECCAACGSLDWTWESSSGKGRVFSWTVVHRALQPAFAEDVPYVVAIIELEEGVRMVSHVVGLAAGELRLDLSVEVAFDDVTPEVTLPTFRPVRG
jgi:uncharacterized OB-fold protein